MDSRTPKASPSRRYAATRKEGPRFIYPPSTLAFTLGALNGNEYLVRISHRLAGVPWPNLDFTAALDTEGRLPTEIHVTMYQTIERWIMDEYDYRIARGLW